MNSFASVDGFRIAPAPVSDPSAVFWKNGTAPASWRIVLLLFLSFPVQAFLMVLNDTSDFCFASLDINSPHTDLSMVCCVFFIFTIPITDISCNRDGEILDCSALLQKKQSAAKGEKQCTKSGE